MTTTSVPCCHLNCSYNQAEDKCSPHLRAGNKRHIRAHVCPYRSHTSVRCGSNLILTSETTSCTHPDGLFRNSGAAQGLPSSRMLQRNHVYSCGFQRAPDIPAVWVQEKMHTECELVFAPSKVGSNIIITTTTAAAKQKLRRSQLRSPRT